MSSAPYPWQKTHWQQQVDKLAQRQLPQSLLIAGPAGCGKADFAQELARLGLCSQSAEHACGECGACRTFAAGSQADWIQVRRREDKKEIVIDQIRDFCNEIQLTANSDKGRFALIHNADLLNRAAANALLKTLEEPPRGAHIFLTAQQLSRIPATIRSRCNRIVMPQPDDRSAREWLGADFAEAPDRLIRRLGPVALKQQKDQLPELIKQELGWGELLDNLKNDADALKAAAGVKEVDFDSFLDWWQSRILQDMKATPELTRMQKLWDAILRLRRQGQGSSINRLLALEGLFILYIELVQQVRQ